MKKIDYSLLPVSKASSKPLSHQIEDWVLRNVETGNLPPGSRLPPEREVSEHFGVARGTVKAAYQRLQAKGLIHSRQGSGSYVRQDRELVVKMHRTQAQAVFSGAISKAQALGFKPHEMREIFEICMARNVGKIVNIAVISHISEMLLDFKKQLSALLGATVSVILLDNLTENPHPMVLLGRFDLLLVPSQHHARLAALVPSLSGRIMEISAGPSPETLASMAALRRDSRVGIICRTNMFLVLVRDLLLQHGFLRENIQYFLEMDYTVETYFPGGIDALISFRDAHIFTDPNFEHRNKEFVNKGGILIPFAAEIDRGSVVYIESQVRQLILQAAGE